MTYRYKGAVQAVAVLSVLLLLTGCGSNQAASRAKTGNKVEDTVQGEIQKEKNASAAAENTTEVRDPEPGSGSQGTKPSASAAGSQDNQPQEREEKDKGNVDCDLTTMGADMVYANVFQMMTEPESFVGKRVRISGILNVVSVDGHNYYCCIIKDAQGCCQNGIEFVWGDGSHRYPEEYPEENTKICVTGVFETYQENGGQNKYCRLKNADLNWQRG